tara:strand:+ start:1187 stop:1441 length:255 start_codon:yes stop_codon:yes gene_type:complete
VPFYVDFLKKGRGEAPKSFVDKGLRPQKTQKNIEQGLDIGSNSWYNIRMKNTYHIHAWTVISASPHIETHQCIDCGEKRTIYVD